MIKLLAILSITLTLHCSEEAKFYGTGQKDPGVDIPKIPPVSPPKIPQPKDPDGGKDLCKREKKELNRYKRKYSFLKYLYLDTLRQLDHHQRHCDY